jgi:hypothetical protein
VAKLVDALALGASAVRHEGSSPFLGTSEIKTSNATSVWGFNFLTRKDLEYGVEEQ